MPSFKAEVIADSSGKFCGNGLRFATHEEAEAYAKDLAWRWTAVREWRVVESSEAPNYGWSTRDGRAVMIVEDDSE